MTFEYIQKAYGVSVHRGKRVSVYIPGHGWVGGSVTSADHRIKVKPDCWPKKRMICHPTDTDVIRYPSTYGSTVKNPLPHRGKNI